MFDLLFDNALIHYNDVKAIKHNFQKVDELIFVIDGTTLNIVRGEDTDIRINFRKVFQVIVMFQKLVVKTRFLEQRITDEIAYLDFTNDEIINAQYKHFKTILNDIEQKQEQATKLVNVLTSEEKKVLKKATENKDAETINKIKEEALKRIDN